VFVCFREFCKAITLLVDALYGIEYSECFHRFAFGMLLAVSGELAFIGSHSAHRHFIVRLDLISL
jgi:hypothetical protein